ncbi:cytochrome P450 [Aspergillus puulaauensis]|uniref:Cytochrome P450 n=1 Tax=Aspergillus puulaauensis TaxID=1220207 RepID=A0A7R7XCA0_9EURO|nr:uncharacterized protein APUU_11463S [Aspergillus puulaauensis]BCS18635.1 hypothetical protein APUU_11463S [Aspergillus puulaauensis]
MTLSLYASTALAGIFSHVAYFNRGEHHLYGLLYIKLLLTSIISATAILSYTQQTTVTTALSTVAKVASSYLVGLYSSLLIYRVLLHPLNKFPGPLPARASTSWLTTQLKNNLHTALLDLHQQHGLFVRIGSSDLSISHPDAVELIYGSNSRCIKGQNYELVLPTNSLQLMRNVEQHHTRRRIWSTAFSDKLLRGYEQRIRPYRQRLINRISEISRSDDSRVNIRKWFDLYSFDVMGDLAFSEGFQCLEQGKQHWVIEPLISMQDHIGMFFQAWAFAMLAAIPGLSKGLWTFVNFCGEKLMERFEHPPATPDISSALLAPLKGKSVSEVTPEEKFLLYGDAQLIVIAGSDTTSGALSAIFYELARHPEEIKKLRAELEAFVGEGENKYEFLNSKIAHLNHLNGVINEVLRLYPAVPSALQRKTPPEGIVVDGVHVPGDTHVYCPLYVVGRSELAYAQPDEFIPERWYSRPELVRHKSAFAPFSLGPFNCIGRPLALINLRDTLAQLIMEFDVEFAPGEDGARFLGDAKDNFVFYAGEVDLLFTPRS